MGEGAKDFRVLQLELAAHVRDPENNAGPDGLEDRRLGIYRELLYNNVQGFMANSFPVLRSILPDEQWHSMIRRYFARHRARTPFFPKLPQEFLRYLADEDPPLEPAFIHELVHYEWLELEVLLDKRELSDAAISDTANCMDGVPVLNPVARVHAYVYDVHRIGPEYQPVKPPPQPTYLVVYRDRSDEVGFMELNPVTARLVELIMQDSGASGRALLQQIAVEMEHPDPSVVIAGGRNIMQELVEKDLILGAR